MRSLCSHCSRSCNCSITYSGSCPLYDDNKYSPSATYKEPEETTYKFPEIKPTIILSPKQYGMSIIGKRKKRK